MNRRFFFAITLMALATTVAMVSCKKEPEKISQAEVCDPQNDAVVQRILDFKCKVDERKEAHP